MSGTLYVVTTPIGNLSDLTPRAAETFAAVDFIAAEDTRVTLRLLNHLGLKKQLICYREHNENQQSDYIIDRLLQGESCALCSDAGVPAISDPGEELVRRAIEQELDVVPVPAASAAVTALCVSGQDTTRFVFEGFLPQNRRQRNERLEDLKSEQRTMIFYEAPHKLKRTLEDLAEGFGSQRSVTLCRELTKIHEEICKTTFAGAIEKYEQDNPRGEFVLVVAGGSPPVETQPSIQEAARQAISLAHSNDLSPSAAAKQVAAQTGHSKSAVYKEILSLKGEP